MGIHYQKVKAEKFVPFSDLQFIFVDGSHVWWPETAQVRLHDISAMLGRIRSGVDGGHSDQVEAYFDFVGLLEPCCGHFLLFLLLSVCCKARTSPPSLSLMYGYIFKLGMLACKLIFAQYKYESSLSGDCRETDPNMKKVLQHRISLLKEEIDLRVTVARESLKRTETAIEMSKKTSARFQNEAAKCRICVETCEEVRERAEAELVEERRLTKLWEKRARKHGWTNNSIIYVQG
ncbi:hypothetical protein CRG98_024169 [Punica granatum]|uniref:Uncharacterized protein n=1 Tax=Punica granatum TaxID=22663 RepID=A0A2I0JIL4_PUNGR|nr:hypothetical protein CRG98_024169 [Punica granatum]